MGKWKSMHLKLHSEIWKWLHQPPFTGSVLINRSPCWGCVIARSPVCIQPLVLPQPWESKCAFRSARSSQSPTCFCMRCVQSSPNQVLASHTARQNHAARLPPCTKCLSLIKDCSHTTNRPGDTTFGPDGGSLWKHPLMFLLKGVTLHKCQPWPLGMVHEMGCLTAVENISCRCSSTSPAVKLQIRGKCKGKVRNYLFPQVNNQLVFVLIPKGRVPVWHPKGEVNHGLCIKMDHHHVTQWVAGLKPPEWFQKSAPSWSTSLEETKASWMST